MVQPNFFSQAEHSDKGSVVLVMQRLHAEDLSGYLLANNSDWQHLKIPVRADKTYIFPNNQSYKFDEDNLEKINFNEKECSISTIKKYTFLEGEVLHTHRNHSDYLTKLEHEIGSAAFAAQYMQEPIEKGCANDITFYEVILEKFDYFIQSWDTAIKTSEAADYIVCTCWGVVDKTGVGEHSKYYLVSMIRHKFNYPELKIQLKKLSAKYCPRFILIEDKASGQQLIQDLIFDGFTNIVAIKPKLDKITRFISTIPLFQSGRVLIPNMSNFKSVFITEVTSFPNSKNDDIVDSVSQFLNFAKGLTTKLPARIRRF